MIGVTLTVLPQSDEEATRCAEVLGRAAAGLALEGLTVSLGLATYEPDEED